MPPQAATIDFDATSSSTMAATAIDDALFGQGIDNIFSSGQSYLDDFVVDGALLVSTAPQETTAPPAAPLVVPEESAPTTETPKPPLEKPRRMLTPYNIFFKDERARLLAEKQKGQKLGFAELARAVSSKWKILSDDDKKHYEYRSRLDKQRHAREMAAWRSAGGGGVDDGATTTGKRSRSPSQKAAAAAVRDPPRYKSRRLAARRSRWGSNNVDN